jgi:hypothetical protein
MADSQMRLFIPAMEAVLVEVAPDGRVRFEGEEWTRPSLQERRAIIHAAQQQIEELQELLQMVNP